MEPKSVKAFKQGDSTVVVIPSIFAELLEIGPNDYLTVEVDLKNQSLIYKKTKFKLKPLKDFYNFNKKIK